jgi:hypothetical protein
MKDIVGFEDYAICADGRVWSKRTVGFLKPTIVRGYQQVCLSVGGFKVKRAVHRLVAWAFIPNPEGKPQVNHRNGVKADNRVENLEWATCSENILHAFSTGLNEGRKGEEHHAAKLTEADVIDIRTRYAAGGIFQRELADEFGLTPSTVGEIIRLEIWKHVA